jgi:DNA-binding XRE family transcriptional regulator
MPPKPPPKSVPSDAAIVAKAALHAADRLDLTRKLLAKIIGVSEATVSRMRRGEYPLENKPFELAIMFIHLYRLLDAEVGGDDVVAKAWLRNKNSALKEAPIDLIHSVWGLTDVIQYLDARRAIA